MKVENRIREIWRQTPALLECLPLERLSTGMTVCESYPLGVFREKETTWDFLTNDGFLQEKVTWEMVFWADSHAWLKTLSERLLAVLLRKDDFQVLSQEILCADNNAWKLVLDGFWKGIK
ncbi:MAG: hypothetical protein Q4D62_13685 [Planctomycetia bacterium]|nr:hypothetical protein [Planctomycetia bacterium]